MVITLHGPKLDPKLRVPTVWGTPVLFGLSQNQSWIQLHWLSSRDNCKSGHAWAMTMLILLLRTTGAGAEKGSLSWKHLGTYFLQVCCVSSAEPHPLSSPTLLCPCWAACAWTWTSLILTKAQLLDWTWTFLITIKPASYFQVYYLKIRTGTNFIQMCFQEKYKGRG